MPETPPRRLRAIELDTAAAQLGWAFPSYIVTFWWFERAVAVINEWQVDGVRDLGEVVAWATARDADRRFAVSAVVETGAGTYQVRVHGYDPTEGDLPEAVVSDPAEAARLRSIVAATAPDLLDPPPPVRYRLLDE
jgi:hypothetical protein